MNDKISACEISLTPEDNHRLMNLCGRFDEHLRQIEKRLGVEINNRGNQFSNLRAIPSGIGNAHQLLNKLYAHTAKGELSPATVHLFLQSFAQSSKHRPETTFTKRCCNPYTQHAESAYQDPQRP